VEDEKQEGRAAPGSGEKPASETQLSLPAGGLWAGQHRADSSCSPLA